MTHYRSTAISIKRSVLKGMRNPKGATAQLVHQFLAPVGHTRFRPFIVLSRSRTGSNLLVSRLNSHPNVRADGELFSHLNQRSHTRVLRKAFSRQPFYVKAKGFKMFYYHPHDDRSGRVWQELIAVEGLHVIHLRRRNILRTLVSRKLAGLEDVWTTTSPERGRAKRRKDLAVSFSVEELRQGFRETREWEQAGDERFSDQPLIGVTYEDLVAAPMETFSDLTDFLGVPYRPPSTTLKKQNTRSLVETVTNYGGLKAAFAGTEWEEFFED